MKGFLGTQAGFAADLNLTIQLAMGIALLAGTFLARAKRYKAHGACQSSVLLLNLVMIAVVMWPAFSGLVIPRIPARLARRSVAIPALHGILGAAAEILGLYIVIAAGTNVLPKAWRFARWKLWMRVEMALWGVVLFTGFGTYYVWYVAPRH
jgi:uncharacterized membrane protein YozB (DUF420 family)